MQCPEQLLGSEIYFSIILFTVGAVVNGVKRIPFIPGDATPVLAFMVGWSIDASFGNIYCGLSYTVAAFSGLGGGLAGLGAAGGHEALSRTAKMFGLEGLATRLLGKAKSAKEERPKGKSSIALVFLVAYLACVPFVTSCNGALATAAKAAHVVGNALEILDAASSGAKKYLGRHPSLEKEEAIGAAIELVRDAVKSGKKEKAVKLYRDLLALLDEAGITSATPPDGGSETDAPKPEPLTLATAEEFKATL